MKIEMITTARVNLKGYGFPEFDILIVPSIRDDSSEVVYDCYLLKRGHAAPYFVFGCYESIEEAAALAYSNVPDYLPEYVESILSEE